MPIGRAPDPRPASLTGPRARSAILKLPDARRHLSFALLVLFASACAGGAPRATTPAPIASEPERPAATKVVPTDAIPAPAASATMTTAPATPVVLDSALLATTADSAADEAALEDLRAAAPAEGAGDERAARASTGGAESTELAVATWDIDVTSFLSHERVQYYLDFFQGPGRERFGAWLQRMPRYEPMIRERFARQGLPSDLLYLALIESGFSNSATSRARAVGMWQFMPATGRAYGLRVDRWVDERRDPVKATDAAARHLDDLRVRFGSLYLAAAAYNAGGGKVSRGLRRLGDGPEDDLEGEELTSDSTFFLLYDTSYLRRETKDYVPKLIAAALIAKEPERYGFTRPAPIPALVYDSITVPDATGLDVIARLAGTEVSILRELNPQFLRLITPPGSRAVIRLPVGTADATATKYAALPARERVTFREHVVQRNEVLGAIARRYGVGVDDVRAANRNIAPNRLRIGMTLIIPVSPAFDARAIAATESPAQGRRVAGTQRGNVTWHKVRRGESWWSIATRYGVSVADLQGWNDAGPRERLKIGQRVRVRAGVPSGRRSVAQPAARPATQTTPRAAAATTARPATYRVKSGDTLSGIAVRFGVTEANLRRLNRLPANGTVQAGKVLKLR